MPTAASSSPASSRRKGRHRHSPHSTPCSSASAASPSSTPTAGITSAVHLARSPEARGRSERAFGTIQGRLPQELRDAGITGYDAANTYLETVFLADFNRRFTVRPAQPESAFVPLVGIDLRLLLSVQHERVVRNDSTVLFDRLTLQLPPTRERPHYVRCPVLVHEVTDGTLALSHQGKLLARYTRQGTLIEAKAAKGKAA